MEPSALGPALPRCIDEEVRLRRRRRLRVTVAALPPEHLREHRALHALGIFEARLHADSRAMGWVSRVSRARGVGRRPAAMS